MANASDFIDRTTRLIDRTAQMLPRAAFAHWLLRLPLAAVLLQYGIEKFPLNPMAAEGFGVPFPLWILAAVGEIAVGLMLIGSGFLRSNLGELVTRLAGAASAIIVAGVIVVAYWAPPLDLLMFNQFHILLLGASLYLALAGTKPARDKAR